MHNVIVIGGGASGLFAAYSSAKSGNKVILLEKNEKLGKKIYITGKGRCNLSNDVLPVDFLNNVIRNKKFLYSTIFTFSPEETKQFFNNFGLQLKTERGNRVFPNSDKASDVTKTLEKAITKENVVVMLNTEVKEIVAENGKIKCVKTDTETFDCDSVIVCTGGVSYPLTGSTGDGYNFAKKLGHKIIDLKPSLVGIDLMGSDFTSLQGLSLKNVKLKALLNDKVVYEDFGEMLFTHFGVSGPIVLSCSAMINRLDLKSIKIKIDLKPALDEKTLDGRLVREFEENKSKEISNTMRALLPASLIAVVLSRAKINSRKKCCEITKEERTNLIKVLKCLEYKVKDLRPIEEAIITSGGVDVKDVNPKTMESKLVKGLFFAGEVLDIDCFTGGFNIQCAFSTGYIAGLNS
ncbi:MAG: NAD(P)/FAD-dependent oxidoreductase [Clostridia bacterium]|nr:NAD(P)/FAD-dependent oxidoreductase [Clostridia bacterium]